MGFIKATDDFGINDDLFVHDQIRDEFFDELLFVENGKGLLLFDVMALLLKFDDQCILIKFLIQPRFERIQNFHRRADNVAGEMLVLHFSETKPSVNIRVIRGFNTPSVLFRGSYFLSSSTTSKSASTTLSSLDFFAEELSLPVGLPASAPAASAAPAWL